jgi:hypothetical protein
LEWAFQGVFPLEVWHISFSNENSLIVQVMHIYIYCNNLVPGMAAACYWGIESGKLVYLSIFGHVPACIYMSHRSNESFTPRAAEEVACVHGIMLVEKWVTRIIYYSRLHSYARGPHLKYFRKCNKRCFKF